MNRKRDHGKIVACPGLKITANAGISWTDQARRVHDLVTTRMLTIAEVAAHPLMHDMGFGTADAVAELVRAKRIFPVWRKNARVVRVYECAIPDFRARCLAGTAAKKVA
jgi:hypothetical protein